MGDTSLVFNIIAKDKASKTFDKLKGAALGAGVAMGLSLGSGVAAGMEKSKADALLAAQLGAPKELAQDLGKASGNLYSKGFAGSVDEAAAGIKAAWQNALVPEDSSLAEIEKASQGVLTLSQTMQEEADAVSRTVSQMIRTGMVKNAQEGFDLLQRGVEQGLNKSQDLLDTFNEYSTQFRKLGIDGPQSMGLISQAIKAGARDSDIAADALKEFSIRAIDGSKLTAQGFQMLGLNAKQMAADIAAGGPKAAAALDTTLDKLRGIKDPVLQSQAAVALFGTQAEDLGKALFSMDLSNATNQLGTVEGAADRAAKTLGDSAGAKVDSFMNTMQTKFVNVLAEVVPWLEKLANWLGKNKEVVLPLAMVVGGLAAILYGVSLATKAWAAAQVLLNTAFWTSPITWIVAGIALVVVGIVLLATKTTFFQTIWNTTWGAIKAAAQAVGEWFAGPFAGFFVGLWNGITSGVTNTKNWIVNTWNSVVGFVTGLPGRMGAALSGMWNGVKSSFQNAVNWVIGKWNNLSFTIGGGTFLGMHVPSFTLSTPNLPYLATGGFVEQSGLAVIHKGETVTPAKASPLPKGGGGGTVKVVIVGGDPRGISNFRQMAKELGLLG